MADLQAAQKTLDDLSKYGASAPDFINATSDKVQEVAGGTEAGDAVTAGLKGAGTGLATGAGVGAGVATAVVALGATAAAAQAVPIVGTIAGAVIGLVAGLVAFFGGKNAAEQKRDAEALAKLQAEWNLLTQRISTAIGLLPEPMHTKSAALLKQTLEEASKWQGSPAKTADAIWSAMRGFPDKLSAMVIQWAAEEAAIERAAATQRRRKRLLGGLAAVGVIGGAFALYKHQEKKR